MSTCFARVSLNMASLLLLLTLAADPGHAQTPRTIPPAEGIPLYINQDLARGDLTAMRTNAANAAGGVHDAAGDAGLPCQIGAYRRNMAIIDRLARLASEVADSAGGLYPRVDAREARDLARRLRNQYESFESALPDCERRSLEDQARELDRQHAAAARRCDRAEMRRLAQAMNALLGRATNLSNAVILGEDTALVEAFADGFPQQQYERVRTIVLAARARRAQNCPEETPQAAPAAPTPPQATSPPANSFMSGQFATTHGEMRLTPRGGSYNEDAGQIIVTRIEGNVMEGIWVERESSRRCADGRFRGRFRFTFSATGFIGVWGYCDAAPNVPWNGQRR